MRRLGLFFLAIASIACSDGAGIVATAVTRADGAVRIPIELEGSLQNPCFSPDGSRLLVTSWLGGYNRPPAIVAVVPVGGGAAQVLTPSDLASVNMPGACWSATLDRIAYSSDEYDDEIFTDNPAGDDAVQITNRSDEVGFEPVFSPDGAWIAFESHTLDVEGDGAIFKVRSDGSELTALTDGSSDDRQPNWSAEDRVLFQSAERTGNNDIFVMAPDGSELAQVTDSPYDDTDASFSPDGAHIVYSSNDGDLPFANLFVIPTEGGTPERATDYPAGYDGAVSFSPDGTKLAFESCQGDPDDSAGTAIWLIDAP